MLLSAEFHYDSNVFRLEDIERLAEQFQTLLESAASNPEASLGELEILERELSGNDCWLSSTIPRPIIEQRVASINCSRNRSSVRRTMSRSLSRDVRLTYAQLNARANQLAHYLQTLGVGPEVPVGICMERCLEMVVGLIGILKAGGAYVPLDPAFPKERRAFILADTRAPVLLTQGVL